MRNFAENRAQTGKGRLAENDAILRGAVVNFFR